MSERSDLEALAAALDAYEPPPAEWTDELWDLYERAEAEQHVLRVRPDHWTDELWEQYRSTEVPEPHAPLTQAQQELFAQERDRERRASALRHLLETLGERRDTRERMAEVRREAERMGLETYGDFAGRWTTRIGAWLAGQMFSWLCAARREPADLAPWGVDLAEQYVLRGFAAEDAGRFLDLSTDIAPRSVAALDRLKESGGN
ncbi:hypothetical protein ABZS83_35165 [Streptomyces sp. NPDC005426]|uniref:hypothetical protein n=1 Tax=Streptomyces sp. NPDC005426 TaxID=3155344 RepID=UPI0033BED581